MAAKSDSPGDAQKPTVRLTRRFAAPAEAVFDAWLDPEQLGHWLFGPDVRDEEVVHLKVDARVGGSFSFLVRRQGTQIDHVGVYRQIDRPHRLVFTWGVVGDSVDESVVTIEICSTSGGCELSLVHEMDPKWADFVDRARQSWTMMVDKLAEMLSASS